MPQEQLVQPGVRRKLRVLRRALRARLFGEGLSWALLAVVGLVLVTLAFDYALRLDRTLRGVIMGGALAGVGWVVWRQILRPLRVPMDTGALALLVEGRFAQLGDRLISAIQFARGGSVEPLGMSDAMVAATAREANRIAGSLNFRRIVERRGLWRAARVALIGLMLLAGFTVWKLPIMELWFRRNVVFAEVDWPQDTYLEVLGGDHFPDFKVIRGDDLEVRVAVREGSVIPPYVIIHAEYAAVGKTEERIDHDRDAPVPFTKKFRNVSEEFRFYVTGGDDRLDKRRKHRVFLVDAPALKELRFTIERPAYMNRPAEALGTGTGVLSVGSGCWVRVKGVSTKDLKGARMHMGSKLGKKQDRICSDLADAGRRMAGLPRRAGPGPGARARELAALAASLRKAAAGQAEILAAIADNPPPADRFSAERIRREIIAPLGAVAACLAGRRAEIGGLSGESPDAAGPDAAKLAQRIAKVARAARDAAGWMQEMTMQVSPSPGDRPPRMRGLKGSFYVWGRNRSEPMTLSILMTDTEGITNRRGARYFLQVSPDTAPTVEVRKRGVGATVTPTAMIPLAVRLKDDSGIASGRVRCAVADRKAPEAVEPIKDLPAGTAEFQSTHVLDLMEHKELALRPGDLIQVSVQATDTMPRHLGGPGIGRSGRLDLRVVKPEDLLDELIRRQKELRIEFAQAIALQVSALGKTLDANSALERKRQIDAGVRRLLGDSGKVQTSVGAECAKAADTIKAIIAEMRNNRLGNKQDLAETDVNVIRPLYRLAGQIRETVVALSQTKAFSDPGELLKMTRKIVELQATHQAAMEAILGNMQKIGSRQEVDKELQRIIGLSKKLLEEIELLADRQTDRAFDPEKPK